MQDYGLWIGILDVVDLMVMVWLILFVMWFDNALSFLLITDMHSIHSIDWTCWGWESVKSKKRIVLVTEVSIGRVAEVISGVGDRGLYR